MTYFPPPDPAPWKRATPGETGLDPDGVAAAARHASEHETPWSRDLGRMVANDFEERPPWNETLGPARPRGGPNGLLLRNGLVVAEWGDTTRVDMTFSVAKSYLSILAGLAWDRGLIGDPHERVRLRVDDGGFDPPHNDAITWHHLLQQTSEWEGVLWDKPDTIDRNRAVGGRAEHGAKGQPPRSPDAGRILGIQRRPGQPAEPRPAAGLAPAVARGVPRARHGSDRRFAGVGMARLSQFLRRDRRQTGAVGLGWRALGRRGFHQRPRPGADRADAVAPRSLGQPPHPLGSLDRTDARALPALRQLRLSVVAQHRARSLSERLGARATMPAAPAAI